MSSHPRAIWTAVRVFFIVPVLAYVIHCVVATMLKWVPHLEAEPDFLAAVMLALPRRMLTWEEREAFDRSGVVFLRGVVANRDLAAFLASKIAPLATQDDDEALHKAWLFHGPVRALVRAPILADLASSALGLASGVSGAVQHRLHAEEAPIWGAPGMINGAGPTTAYHADDRLHIAPRRAYPLVSVWLALSDSAAPLEFVNGSHKVLREIHQECAKTLEGGVADFQFYPEACVDSFIKGRPGAAGLAAWSVDVAAGDAFVFQGLTIHRRLEQLHPRLAISVRYGAQPADFSECFRTHYAFPRDPTWPDCVPWRMIPPLGDYSPTLAPHTRGQLFSLA